MPSTADTRQKNQTLDCFKLIAALLVIFIHVSLPGETGSYANCFARFAVPLFFAVSGYFSFGVRREKLAKRMFHILRLNVFAILAYIVWYGLRDLHFGSLPDPLQLRLLTRESLKNWIVYQINPYAGHLWYLTAIFVCYAVLWLYVGLFKDKPICYAPLYAAALVLFAVRHVVSDLLPLTGREIPYYLCRDGWFIGLPMFSLGLFLRAHRDRLYSGGLVSDIGLLCLFLAGFALSVAQWRIRKSEVPFGAVFQAAALILIAVRHPRLDGGSPRIARFVSSFGFLSTSVYILHLAVWESCLYIFSPVISRLFGSLEPYAMPFIVALLTLCLSVAIERIVALWRSLRKG